MLSNAVYHKSYEIGSPIEVQIWPDKIEVLSFPGPVPPVDAKILSTQRRIVSREYRNRRIGDFLKELGFTEGRGTGFPTIYDAMANNGSPEPIFETNEQSTHVLATLPVHELALNSNEGNNQATNQDDGITFNTLEDIVAVTNQATNQVTSQATNQVKAILNDYVHDRAGEMLEMLMKKMKRSEIFERMDLSNQTFNRAKYLDPLIEIGWVKMEFPEEKTSPNQRYITTESGKRLLKLLNR